jgi:hypothetical protein
MHIYSGSANDNKQKKVNQLQGGAAAAYSCTRLVGTRVEPTQKTNAFTQKPTQLRV